MHLIVHLKNSKEICKMMCEKQLNFSEKTQDIHRWEIIHFMDLWLENGRSLSVIISGLSSSRNEDTFKYLCSMLVDMMKYILINYYAYIHFPHPLALTKNTPLLLPQGWYTWLYTRGTRLHSTQNRVWKSWYTGNWSIQGLRILSCKVLQQVWSRHTALIWWVRWTPWKIRSHWREEELWQDLYRGYPFDFSPRSSMKYPPRMAECTGDMTCTEGAKRNKLNMKFQSWMMYNLSWIRRISSFIENTSFHPSFFSTRSWNCMKIRIHTIIKGNILFY